MRVTFRLPCVLIGLSFVQGCSSAHAQQQILQCPATMPSKSSLPPRSRVIGQPLSSSAPLSHVSVIANTPEKVSANDIDSPEEGEITETRDFARHSTYFETRNGPASLACFYGSGPPVLGPKITILLQPLPSKIDGECVSMHPKRARDAKGRRLASSASCRRMVLKNGRWQ